jgi:hypothetical protein
MFGHHRWHNVRRTALANAAAMGLLRLWGKRWRGVGLLGFLSKNDWELLHPAERRNAVASCFLPDYRSVAVQGLREREARAMEHARPPYPLSRFEATASSYLPEQMMVKVDRASVAPPPGEDARLSTPKSSLEIGWVIERF